MNQIFCLAALIILPAIAHQAFTFRRSADAKALAAWIIAADKPSLKLRIVYCPNCGPNEAFVNGGCTRCTGRAWVAFK